jgi:translation initiation factor IF-3
MTAPSSFAAAGGPEFSGALDRPAVASVRRPGTDEGDYAIKMRNLRRFIAEDGDKGKVTLRFRGREITHQDIGMRLLERIRDELADVSVVEHMPKLEGRQMIMVLAPKKK